MLSQAEIEKEDALPEDLVFISALLEFSQRKSHATWGGNKHHPLHTDSSYT